MAQAGLVAAPAGPAEDSTSPVTPAAARTATAAAATFARVDLSLWVPPWLRRAGGYRPGDRDYPGQWQATILY